MTFTLPDLLRRSAERDPSAPALRLEGATLSYSELFERASAFAGFLVQQGVRRRDRVAIYAHRSFDSMAAIFGTMLAGAAYVPLDSASPPDRIAAVLKDCDVRHLFLGPDHLDDLRSVLRSGAELNVVVGADDAANLPVRLAVPWLEAARGTGQAPPVRVLEEDLSLIFYTSGTTGKPKGVAHSHRSMVSNVQWALEAFDLRTADRVSNVTSHHFDLCWFELYGTVAAGATLVQIPERTLAFPATLAQLASDERITVWCSVPSVLVSLVQRGQLPERDLSALRWVTFAGERFPTKHLRALMAQVPHPRYRNMYGTTETHIAAYWDVPVLTDDAPLPIGQDCAHVELGIVRADGTMAADGETGELVIRGPSLMDGYWGLPERTASVLRSVAFDTAVVATTYHTGDLVRRRADGFIEIVGRGDRRVKVRGHLVDLDEVEAVLLAHEAILEAAAWVSDSEDTTNAVIEAAVLLKPGASASASALRVHVAAVLPIASTPETVEILNAFPRTGSGKVSRRDVRTVAESQQRGGVTSADGRSVREAVRAFVLKEILDPGAKPPGDDDDLVDIGVLDSIAVVRVVAFLEERYGLRVPNDEFRVENFCSFPAMEALIERLLDKPGLPASPS